LNFDSISQRIIFWIRARSFETEYRYAKTSPWMQIYVLLLWIPTYLLIIESYCSAWRLEHYHATGCNLLRAEIWDIEVLVCPRLWLAHTRPATMCLRRTTDFTVTNHTIREWQVNWLLNFCWIIFLFPQNEIRRKILTLSLKKFSPSKMHKY
jgi:hypothetical protein